MATVANAVGEQRTQSAPGNGFLPCGIRMVIVMGTYGVPHGAVRS